LKGIQGIKDAAKITKITKISCNNMNIVSLQGIEQFDSLKPLHLSDNKIVDLLPLMGLDAIEFVDFSGNAELDCSAFEQVIENGKFVDLFKPAHCQ
jgi:Leucine-rich repeat (LRR) protein